MNGDTGRTLHTERQCAPGTTATKVVTKAVTKKKLYRFYGNVKGVWYARKRIANHVRDLPVAMKFIANRNAVDFGTEQLRLIQIYFDELIFLDEGATAA